MKVDITRNTFRKENHFDRVTKQQGRPQLDAEENEQADIRIHRSRITSKDVIGETGVPTQDRGVNRKPHGFEIGPSVGADTEGLGCNYTIGMGRYYIDGVLYENEEDVDATNQPDLPLLLLCAWEDISSNDSNIRNRAIARILGFLRTYVPSFKRDTSTWNDVNKVSVEVSSSDKAEKKTLRTSEFANEFISFTLELGGKTPRGFVEFNKSHDEKIELAVVKDAYDYNKIKLGFSPAIPFKTGKYIVYCDGYEREITFLDDNRLLEVALRGRDTSARTKIVWQVKILPISEDPDRDKIATEDNKKLEEHGLKEEKNQQEQVAKEKRASGTIYSDPHRNDYCYCESQFDEWEKLISQQRGTLQARPKPPSPSRNQIQLPSESAFYGPQHRLYRVEIHDGGAINNGATFKWSRDNGIVASKIADIPNDENTIIVESIGPDNTRFGYPNGSWIEISDDRHELWQIPGTLVKVANVKDNVIIFNPDTVKGESITRDNYPKIYNPKVRRWDSEGPLSVRSVPTENEGYLELEHDIQIRFGGPNDNSDSGKSDVFKTGDYWIIPARKTEGFKPIEWPVGENGNPSALEPEGIKHHFSKLALLSVTSLEKGNYFDEFNRVEEEGEEKTKFSEHQQRNEQGGGVSSLGSKTFIAKYNDCRRFFLPLNLLTLRYVSGDGQEGFADKILPTPLMAQVTSSDIPVKGVKVKFKVEKGGGSLQRFEGGNNNKNQEYNEEEGYIQFSNDDGFVGCRWKLGQKEEDEEDVQQVKATIVNIDSITPVIDLPVYFNANLAKERNDTAKTGELTISLKDSTKHEHGLYRNIKHHMGRKPGKDGPPPFITVGLVSLIGADESSDLAGESTDRTVKSTFKKVQFVRENSIPQLPNKRRLQLRAVNIGSETFDLSIDENIIQELGKKARQMRLRWWAIPCEEQVHQFF